MLILETIVGVLACGVGFRIRGGALAGTPEQPPGQVSRLVFAVIASGFALVLGVPWWAALTLVPAWWIGCLLGWDHSIDLGANEDTFWRDFAVLAARGALWTALPMIVLLWAQEPAWWAMLPAGLLTAPAYWVGRQSGLRLPDLGAGGFPEVGEMITGCIYGLGTVVAVNF